MLPTASRQWYINAAHVSYMMVKAGKSDLSGLQNGNFSTHSELFLNIRQPPISQRTPHPWLWVTSTPNTQDHINSPRNGANDPTRHQPRTLVTFVNMTTININFYT
ncbi:hypothetical protein ACN38_g2838 [Penicillium nordicum]|uniref:Uncharacterized protein n=1 Tax=Penicillium nordicum TaxID=229535 RepID=A0A0M9WIJ6_9EURO|nr:hypothetical protein ACN38_g2838 [Penicillium nordicum]